MKNRRIRRARCLIAYWDKENLVIENYLANKSTTVHPMIGMILQDMENYLTETQVLEKLSDIPKAKYLLTKLLNENIFLLQGSALDKKENLLESWKWKHNVRYFHYSIQHTIFEENFELVKKQLGQLAKNTPPPSPFKDYEKTDFKLSGTFSDKESDFWKVLRSRRTIRQFKRKPISSKQLSELLLWTWGKMKDLSDPVLGQYILKTSPSGGSRHPTEVYPIILRVNDVKPGIYHYSVKKHALENIKYGNFENLAIRLCAGQKWIKNAAVVFFMTSVVGRNMWKYHQSHAYKILLLDAGHLGQTFHLVCTKLGLAPFTHAATRDKEIELHLSIDGVSEIPVYTAVAGIPDQVKITN